MKSQMKIKERIQKYFSSKSKWGIASDIIFVALIIALLIPPSRKEMMVFVKKLTMFQPSTEKVENRKQLVQDDFKWKLQGLDGETVKLKEYKGKVLFINFWATWCPPCIAEMPSIQKLYDQFKDDDRVVFLLISNEDHETIKAFMQNGDFNFPVFNSLTPAPHKLQASAIPKTFIVSKEGSIVLDKTGSAKWHGEKVIDLIRKLAEED